MNYGLQHIYPGVSKGDGTSVGGSQTLLKSAVLQRCGCGVVAALDLVRYLHLYETGCRTDFFTGVEDVNTLPLPVYDLCAQRMRRTYVPVIYPIGTTGFSLAGGIDRYFRHYGLPWQAHWGVAKGVLWQEIGRMLSDDLPVILSVGNQLPRFWRRDGAALYRRVGDAKYASARIHAHYVTVLEMDEKWLKVASWGREYYLSKEEFLRYRDRESVNLLCNIVSIHRIAEEKRL